MTAPTFLIKVLLPRVPKNQAAYDLRKRFFDCQLARRVPEEFFGDSRSLSASSGIQRREGIEKSVEVKNHCNQCLHLAFREKLRKSGRQKLYQVYGLPCRGYRDLYSKWHDKSEPYFLGDASGKILRPYGVSELD